MSIGRIPHVDFWCHYPALGYVIARPFFHLLPESILSVIPLRFFGLCFLAGAGAALHFHARHLGSRWIWGLLPLAAVSVTPEVASLLCEFRTDAYAAAFALLALTLMFQDPTALRSGWVVGLSVLSVVTMPKYAYPLASANLAYLGYGWMKLKPLRRSLATGSLGGLFVSLALAQLLLLSAGVRLWEDVYWSSIFMQRYFVHCAKTERSLQTQFPYALSYFLHYWWVAVMLLMGVSGWLLTELKRKGVQLWVGIAVIAGVGLSWGTCPWPYRQYLMPGLFCLLLFMPYAGALLKKPVFQTGGAVLLVLLCAQRTLSSTREAVTELASGALWEDLRARQMLLNLIPRSERVVGLEYTHPCFREDQTFVTWDDKWGKPQGFALLIPRGSMAAGYFLPDHLAKSLEQSPPASISIRDNYPPGWNQVLESFLQRHSETYQPIPIRSLWLFMRKDLLKDLPKP